VPFALYIGYRAIIATEFKVDAYFVFPMRSCLITASLYVYIGNAKNKNKELFSLNHSITTFQFISADFPRIRSCRKNSCLCWKICM